MADIEPIQTRLLHIVRIPSSGLPTRPAKEPLALAQVFAESFGQMGLQAGDMIGKENRRAQYAVSRVHARTALRWRLDEWAPAALVTGVPSCASMGADGTLVSQMAERPPSGTARAYTPSCRGRFGGCSTPRGLPGTTRPRFALQASSGGGGCGQTTSRFPKGSRTKSSRSRGNQANTQARMAGKKRCPKVVALGACINAQSAEHECAFIPTIGQWLPMPIMEHPLCIIPLIERVGIPAIMGQRHQSGKSALERSRNTRSPLTNRRSKPRSPRANGTRLRGNIAISLAASGNTAKMGLLFGKLLANANILPV